MKRSIGANWPVSAVAIALLLGGPKDFCQFAIAITRQVIILLLTVCLTFSLAAGAAFAQPQSGRGCEQCAECCRHDCCGAEARGAYPIAPPARADASPTESALARREFADRLITLRGEVIDVYQITSKRGNRSGVHLLMQANGDSFDVRLGPSRYLEEQAFTIEPEDFLEIEGKRSGSPEKPTLIAFKVIKGDQVLVLRNQQGVPRWHQPEPASSGSEALPSLENE
jgi:hypothetical protein